MSRFLAFARYAASAEEARAIIKQIQNEYHDARHVCWAYMIGPDRKEWQLNDNGEPSGTAGKPILGQINSKGVTNVVIAVVRYFGGIKLGTSGLTMAYREAARLALEDAGIEECHQMRRIAIEVGYESMDPVMKFIKAENLTIEEKNFDNICRLVINVRADEAMRISGIIADRGGRIEVSD